MIGVMDVTRTAEEVCDLVMNREEALSLPGWLEALHDALATAGRLVRVLCPVVQAIMLSLLDARHDLSLGHTIAGEFIGDQHARCDPLLLEQLAQQPFGGFGITAALDRDVEHGSVLIHLSSEPMLLACDADDNLV
jgi:hypothetical protein